MNEKIENLLEENRKFSPSENLVNNANATSEWFTEANEDRIEFWKKQALERITWYKEPTEVLDDSNAPFYKWFKDGELNLSYNCLDRHLETDADRVAFYWEGEPGDTQEITYQDLYERVCRLSNALKKLNVGKGDRVAIYLGMTPEIVVSMLACARIGAVHSVVFGGFSSEALADRINDAQAKLVITADGAWVPAMIGGRDLAGKAHESLERVGLAKRIDHLPAELSGGEQQRVAIARALVNSPEIIFADEPTGNLDSDNGAQVMDMLMGLSSEDGATLVVVTHDESIAEHGDRKLVIMDGRVAEEAAMA